MLVRLAVVFAILASCTTVPVTGSPTPTSASPVQTGGAFRIALGADIGTLDPWNASDANSALVSRQIFETLVDYEPGGFRIVPKLAETWSVSPDGTTWTFALRRGVKFHDGTDLDAVAVAANFDRARSTRDPLRTAAGADAFRPYAALLGGFDDASVIAKVVAKDATTVIITTRTPFGPLLADLALPSFAIVSPKSIRDDPTGWPTVASSAAAGTGPFVFRPGAWLRDQQITLERNTAYWAKDPDGLALPYVDRVVFRPIRDEGARLAELRAGTLDAMRDLAPGTIATVRADPNLQLLARPAITTAFLGIGARRPFDRVEVRRAVAMAIDKQLIATAIFAGSAKAASQLVVPGMLGYDDTVIEFYRYDASAAKRQLADAGLASGFATEIWYPASWRPYYPEPRRVAESIAADLAKIGVAAAIRTEDPAAFLADVRADRLPLFLGDAGGDSGDPDASFSDVGTWLNDIARELLARARGETDATKRTELYKQVSKLVLQDAARVPLVHSDALVAATRKIHGLRPHPIGVEVYTTVWSGR